VQRPIDPSLRPSSPPPPPPPCSRGIARRRCREPSTQPPPPPRRIGPRARGRGRGAGGGGGATRLWHDFLNFHAGIFSRFLQPESQRGSSCASKFSTRGRAGSHAAADSGQPQTRRQPSPPFSSSAPSVPGAVAPCFHPLADSVCSSVCSPRPLSVSLSLSLSLSLSRVFLPPSRCGDSFESRFATLPANIWTQLIRSRNEHRAASPARTEILFRATRVSLGASQGASQSARARNVDRKIGLT